MAEAANSGLEEFIRFARGLHEDWEAIKAGLSLVWSNGPVEGHMNRLKMLKRQGYGRAGFALLRQRVMRAGEDHQEMDAPRWSHPCHGISG
jgi:transposase